MRAHTHTVTLTLTLKYNMRSQQAGYRNHKPTAVVAMTDFILHTQLFPLWLFNFAFGLQPVLKFFNNANTNHM